jgi:DeoR/GlpR family transcriptional regulator of sugar metabolism
MLAIERRNEILAKLQEDKKVVVSELSQFYQVTEETIRRDLEKLENEGMAKKTYGGAVLNESFNNDLPYTVRKKTNVRGKRLIAEQLSEMIPDGSTLILDASSTALFIAKRIKDKKNMTVITNSLEILLELSDRTGWKILSTGGILKEGGLALVGYQTEKMLGEYHVDMAIFSCKAIDMERGMSDSNESDAQIKRVMVHSAKIRILAVDSSKFGRISFMQIGGWSELDMVVTDQEPDEAWKRTWEDAGVEIVY